MVWLLAQVEGDNEGGVAKQTDGVEEEKQKIGRASCRERV